MKRMIAPIGLLLLFLVVTPGVGGERLFPQEVAEKFWTAIQEKDIPVLRKHIVLHSLEKEELASHLPSVNSFELGRVLVEGDRAWIETDVVMGGDEPVTLPLETVLVKENGQWKVLYEKTVATTTEASDLAHFLERISDLTAQLERKLNRSLEELQRSAPQIEQELEELEKKLEAQIPEIKERIEGLMKELEELFEAFQQEPSSDKERAI